MSFFDSHTFEKTLEGLNPFSGVTHIFAPELSPILSNKQEITRTFTNNVHNEPVNTTEQQTQEQTQADKINHFVNKNKVMIGGSFALLIIFMLLR